jgi:hypothetical protein
MFLLYLFLGEIPKETCDPETKERYGLPLFMNSSGVVIKTAVGLMMAAIGVNIIVCDFFPSFTSSAFMAALAELMLGVFLTTIPLICVLLSTLIYCGLLAYEG